MKTGLAQDTTKSAKSLAQQIAKQMAREPLEILKDAGDQISDRQEVRPLDGIGNNSEDQQRQIEHQNDLQDKMKSTRRMEALDRELEDIRKQDLFKDLQAKIAQGIEVPLEDYSELTMEQKQVLKAQMEAVKFQKDQAEYNESQKGFQLPASKKGRKMGGGQKGQAEKEQTRVEKPVPPSG